MSVKVTELKNLPFLNVTSPVSAIPHLTNIDVDCNMPSDQNFNYYTTHDFHSNYDINDFSRHSKSFAPLKCNIRSLQGNHENLVHMLSELQFPFSVIGLSEIKFKVDKDIITNVNIPGYDFISQPSLSNAGGVGFYIKNKLTFTVLSELSVTKEDVEAL